MFKKYLSHILVLFILIDCVFTQGPPPPYPKHPNDPPFYDMEKKGMKPKDINLKFEDSNNPNLIVDAVEIKDQDNSNDIITNKSKLKITWKVNNDPSNINNMNNNLPQTFTLKLLSNVTQDSETKLFYSYDEQIIQPNLNDNQFEYKVPKLNENLVYNIAVIADPNGISQNNSIGLSKTFIYKLYEKVDTSSISKDGNKNDNKSGINPLIYLGIGIFGVIVIGLAFLISKGFSKKDNHEEDEYNLPVQSPNGSFEEKNLDRVSVITDDTGEVSWSNLEIAKTSQQTKNEANDNVYRTLDKKFKRDTKDKSVNEYVLNEKQLYKVVRMFNPSEDDEVKLNIGDEVEIHEIFEDGWCEGVNKSLNKGGVFPRTCVVEAEQYASMIEKSKNSLLPNRRRSKHNSYSANKNSYYQFKDYFNYQTTASSPIQE